MTSEKLIFVIAECIIKAEPKGIKQITVDSESPDSDLTIETKDGDTFVLRSRLLRRRPRRRQ